MVMMEKSGSNGSSKPDRKTIEKNRRMRMKGLSSELFSLIPPKQNTPLKEILTLPDQLDHATNYIKNLRERIEGLKARKEFEIRTNRDSSEIGLRLPILELKDLGSKFEVILIGGFNKKFKLYEVISILEAEGAQIVNANIFTLGDKIFHTIHAQEVSSRIGVELSSIRESLEKLIY